MSRETVFTLLPLSMFIGFAYTAVKANYIIISLRKQIQIPYHWSGRTSITELKQAENLVKDDNLRKQVRKAISLLYTAKIIAYGGFVLFVLLMFIWKS